MLQRWRFRCYPTPAQEDILARTFGCVRYVYNWGLSLRTAAFRAGVRKTHSETDSALTLLKKQPETLWLNDVSAVPLQQTLRDLQFAFASFFAKRSAYPVFKKKGAYATARYTKAGFRFSDGRRVEIAKMGVLRVRWDRNLPSNPSSLTVIRSASGRYYVSFVVDAPIKPLPMTGESVGLDFGIIRLATLSTGETIPNPRHANRSKSRLALVQRRLAKKTAHSKRREKARITVARVHEKVANQRKDALNKLTTTLVTRFDAIFIEDLDLREMSKNHGISRSLSDVGIGIATRMLEDKARRHGKSIVKINRWFPSSKMCSACGRVAAILHRGEREWSCQACGSVHDRDLNAARNILAVGQTVAAHGDGVRAASALAEEASLL